MSSPEFIDTHCHLHDREFFTSEESEMALKRSYKNSVRKIIVIGTRVDDSIAAANFAATHTGKRPNTLPTVTSTRVKTKISLKKDRNNAKSETQIFPSFGIHPSEWKTCKNQSVEDFIKIVESLPAKPVAIGEVGLDYHYGSDDREAQIHLLEQMLKLAIKLDLPLSFHVREAFPDFFGVIANFSKIRGVVHSFTDSRKTLRKILETTDLYVGVNGLATYSTLPTPPLSRTLLETDSPFLCPKRGMKNTPEYIPVVAEFLAEKFGTVPEEVAEVTTRNAEGLFKI